MALGAIGCAVDSLSGPARPRSTSVARAIALMPRDPRILQIVFLGALLAAGAYFRDFSLRPAQSSARYGARVDRLNLATSS